MARANSALAFKEKMTAGEINLCQDKNSCSDIIENNRYILMISSRKIFYQIRTF